MSKMTDIAISVLDISKRYFIYENQRARLGHALWPTRKAGVNEIWALREVSFEVKRGEAVGIVGRNGSGKSTLLEIITQTLAPTTGNVSVNGRVAALLELGSGFKPDFTGRENVFLNAMLMGLTRTEVESRFDSIASFADIGDVLDRPVKTYSSGMLVRLAFAVQVALEPEILIIDEALSVGDYFFQQKCFARLRQMRQNGLTLLFVSHDLKSVRDICDEAIHLGEGRVVYKGEVKKAINSFMQSSHVPSDIGPYWTRQKGQCSGEQKTEDAPRIIEKQLPGILWEGQGVPEDSSAVILAVGVYDETLKPSTVFTIGQEVIVRIAIKWSRSSEYDLALGIRDKFDKLITVTGTRFRRDGGRESSSSGVADIAIVEIGFKAMIEGGVYSMIVTLSEPTLPNQGVAVDQTPPLGPLQVNWDYQVHQAPFLGLVGLPVSVRYLI